MESRGGVGRWRLKKAIFEGLLRECLPSRTNEAIESLRAVNGLLLHTRAFLNAHQNNLSKPRDAFLRCLMGGQIGNHFNKIPLRLNCISQEKTRSGAGWSRGNSSGWAFTCSFGAFEKESIDCVDRFYGGRTRKWNARAQKRDCGNAEAGISLDTGTSVRVTAWKQEFVLRVFVMFAEGAEREKNVCSTIFTRHLFEVKKTITSRALRRPSYFNYIVPVPPQPPPHLPPLSATPSLHKHTHTHRENGITLHTQHPRAM